jgi:hypothetical protein
MRYFLKYWYDENYYNKLVKKENIKFSFGWSVGIFNTKIYFSKSAKIVHRTN